MARISESVRSPSSCIIIARSITGFILFFAVYATHARFRTRSSSDFTHAFVAQENAHTFVVHETSSLGSSKYSDSAGFAGDEISDATSSNSIGTKTRPETASTVHLTSQAIQPDDTSSHATKTEHHQPPPTLATVPFELCSPLEKLCVQISSIMSLQEPSSDVNATFIATYKAAKDIPMYGKLTFTFAENAKHTFKKPVSSSSAVLESSWDPISGSQSTFKGKYIETNVSWAYANNASKSPIMLQLRVYDFMLATRVVYGADNAGRFDTAFNYANTDKHLSAVVYGDHGDEGGAYQTNGNKALKIPRLTEVHQTPLSIDLKQRKGSRLTTWFSEACTFDTSNARIQGILNSNVGYESNFPDLQSGGDSRSPFFVWQFSDTMIGLANLGESIGMLCDAPPEGRAAFDWVTAGKQVRVPGLRFIKSKADMEMNVRKTAALCKQHNICQYLLYDAGWYGDEYVSKSDPMKPVAGFDLNVICNIGKEHGLKTIMYINEVAMTSPKRVEELSRYLVEAGVDGVKMGFVTVISTPSMRNVINFLRIFGRHKLVVNIHDHVCGFGIQRTFPHLLSVEGVAGDEHYSKDYTQRSLILPFTRAKAGRMDFTFLNGEKALQSMRLSPLAQVAKSVILGVNGLWTIYWYAGWDALERLGADKESPFSLWNEVSNEWTASVFLDSSPGDYVSVAREQSSGTWYIIALARVAHTFSWPLSSLLLGKNASSYTIQRWTESGVSNDVELVTAYSTLTCSVADDKVTKQHGGCIIRLTPVVHP